MSVLRVYDPAECDEHGVPLDWERCRACLGGGTFDNGMRDCPTCDGHGSVKAAALAGYLRYFDGPVAQDAPVRCEGCGHPMSEGTLEGDPSISCAYVEKVLRGGGEPLNPIGVHYSPCDEGCRHGGPGRNRASVYNDWQSLIDLSRLAPGIRAERLRDGRVEASWRPVDVRPLGWPHDLRPERLAVLCLRCWLARSTEGAPHGV